ncbi:MAG: hypothetical protein J6X14_04215, partial [Lachnospiraceae bacterium]|nr:hypothetical protein [Lachnospiraceae bacterium]
MKMTMNGQNWKIQGVRSIMLCVLFVMAICFMGSKAEAKNGTWTGDGSEANPYLIEDVADLQSLQQRVNGGDSCKGLYFIIRNNLDLSSVCGEKLGSWEPIGSDDVPFAGIFMGGGHKIQGLYVSGVNGGLFG